MKMKWKRAGRSLWNLESSDGTCPGQVRGVMSECRATWKPDIWIWNTSYGEGWEFTLRDAKKRVEKELK